MQKIGAVILGIIAIFLLIGPFRTPIVDGIKGWRTSTTTENFVVVTAASQTTANVTLGYDLYQAKTASVDTITSTVSETPAASSYVEATKVLLIAGLDDANTRTLTVEYSAETDDTVMQILGPFLALLIFGGLTFAIIYAMAKNGKGRR